MKKTKISKIIEIVGVLVLILVFSSLIIRYYDPFYKESNKDKYVDFDYSELEREANLIIPEENNLSTQSIVVLNYHGVNKNETESTYSISAEKFKEHMFALRSAGYQTVGIEDLYAFLRGEKQLPKKSFVLTFDDGIKTSYYNVDSVLKALGYRAVIFVIAGFSLEKNSSYYLNVKELKEMQATGRWDLQIHTYAGHLREVIDQNNNTGPFYSNKLWIAEEGRIETNEEYFDRVNFDLVKGKELLGSYLNNNIMGFALPFGDFGQRETNYYGSDRILINLAEKYYKMLFYQFKPARNKDFRANYNNEKKDFYLVMRISADDIETPQELMKIMEAAQSLDLPYNEKFDNEKRWIAVWGNSLVGNDDVALRNDVGNSGAMAYLDGSYLWQNYNYAIRIKELGAKKVMLVGRFQDSENYAACRYENGSVSIINVRDKIKKVIYEEKYPYELKNGVTLSMEVSGDKAVCLIEGKKVVEGPILHIPANGGVGMRVEEFFNYKEFLFDNISVKEIIV